MVFRRGPGRWDEGWRFEIMVEVNDGGVDRVSVFVLSVVWGLLSL